MVLHQSKIKYFCPHDRESGHVFSTMKLRLIISSAYKVNKPKKRIFYIYYTYNIKYLSDP